MSTEEQGIKHDAGKPLAGVLLDFSRALMDVSRVATYGCTKYPRSNWLLVDDAQQRYTDAMMRHLLTAGVDDESGLMHLSHAAWNMLAVIELKLREKERCEKEARTLNAG